MLDPGSLTVFAGPREVTARRILAIGTGASRSGGAVLHVSPEAELPELVHRLRRTATVPARTFAWALPATVAERPHLSLSWQDALAFCAAIVLLRNPRLLVTLPPGVTVRTFGPECEAELRRRGCAVLAQAAADEATDWLARADGVYRVRAEGGLERVTRSGRAPVGRQRAVLG